MRLTGRVLGLVGTLVLLATGCPAEGDGTASGTSAVPATTVSSEAEPEDPSPEPEDPSPEPEDPSPEPEAPSPEPMDWGSLPDIDQIEFEVQFAPSDACPNPPTGPEQLRFFFFPSPRGLATGMSGFLDGTGFMGDGVFEFQPIPLRISRNDVPTTEWDDLDLEVTPEGVTGSWRFIEAEGDLEELDPTLGAPTACGDFTATGPEAGQLFEILQDAPPLDLDAGGVTGWSCANQGGDLIVGGTATALPEGSTILLVVEISGTEFRQLEPLETTVGPDGGFSVVFPGDGVPGDVAVRASHGVYGLGAQFLGPDACGG